MSNKLEQINQDLFDEVESRLQDIIDPEEIINIDFDGMEESAKTEAEDMITNLSRLYYNEEFMKSQPNLKKRIDSDLESLRINLKMRKADELAHDVCLKHIGQSPANASLYRSLTDLQRSIISITTKIEDIVARLTNLLKGYQTEIQFSQNIDENGEDNSEKIAACRGSKEFIKKMMDED